MADNNPLRQQFEDKRVVIFLDYDGTLTPIVSRPEDARLSEEMRDTLKDLTQKCTVSIISGRGLDDARKLLDVPGLYFAGSHGFEIEGPNNVHMELEAAREMIPVLDESEQVLRQELEIIPGLQVERKKYSLAVHYRNVPEESAGEVENIVDRAIARFGRLRKGYGKKVFEIRPDILWDSGLCYESGPGAVRNPFPAGVAAALRKAGYSKLRDIEMERHQPQNEARVPRRRHHQPV